MVGYVYSREHGGEMMDDEKIRIDSLGVYAKPYFPEPCNHTEPIGSGFQCGLCYHTDITLGFEKKKFDLGEHFPVILAVICIISIVVLIWIRMSL